MRHRGPLGILAGLLLVPACGGEGGGPSLPGAAPLGNLAAAVAPFSQTWVRVVPGTDGGAFAFWRDTRSGSGADVYGQRFDSDGRPLWTPGGIALTASHGVVGGLRAVPDGAGGALFAWVDYRDFVNSFVYAQRVSPSGAALWAADGILVFDDPSNQYEGQLDMEPDGAGGAHVLGYTWEVPTATEHRLQRLSPAGARLWGDTGVLAGVAQDQPWQVQGHLLPRAGGHVVLAWEYSDIAPLERRIFLQRFDAAGAPLWSPGGVEVLPGGGIRRRPRLAPGPSDSVILAWAELASGGHDLLAQRYDAAGVTTWNPAGVVVCALPGSQIPVAAASDGAGGLISLVHTTDADGWLDVVVARVDANGAGIWTTILAAVPDQQVAETLVADGANGAVAVWKDFRSRTSYDLYAQRVGPGGAPLWTAGGERVAVARYDQSESDATVSGGRLFAAWCDRRDEPEGGDVYHQILTLGGAALPPVPAVAPPVPDHAFNRPIVAVSGGQDRHRAISDGAGGAFVVWRDQRFPDGGAYAQRFDAAGVPLWTSGGVRLSATGDLAVSPDLCSDGAGGIIVTWDSSPDIQAQRLSPAGIVLWAAGGLLVCAEPTDQVDPRIVADGAGGAVIAWVDYRNYATLESDLYAQRIDASGAKLWAAAGVALSASAAGEDAVELLPDGAGGVLAAWSDDRNGTLDVFARRLDGAGASAWGPLTLCGQPGAQRTPRIVPDGAGGLIAAWKDERTATQLYAQRVSGAGATAWAADGVAMVPGATESFVLAADGAGGAVGVVRRSVPGAPATWQLFGQRVNGAGALQWAADLQLTSGRSKSVATILPGSGGGVFLAWETEAPFDLGLQEIDGSGTAHPGPEGVPLSSAAWRQTVPALVGDGVGGVWAIFGDDRRGGSYQTYAQHSGALAP